MIFPYFIMEFPVGNSLIPNLVSLIDWYFFAVSVMSILPEYAAMESSNTPPAEATLATLN